ncbi:MAG: hypothetical protein IJN67_04780 [Oscillospiraceae bacterium]|nr:hypothetical protein [Oscillospiraceae bacterium]
MRKFVLGLVLFSVGFLGAILLIGSLVCSPESPWIVNGVEGIYSGIAFMKMQIPMSMCIITAVCGLVLAIKETNSKK